jgi:tetratricopeptide (TPR) repeat protein
VAAGRRLNVESVLDGNIRRSGDDIRVTVQLISVRDAIALWADKFDEKFTDIFTVEDSISERVVEALMLKLTSEEMKMLRKHYTENTEAYQLYLKGRYYWNKRTTEALRKAIDCFERAISIDNHYALAYDGIADCYTILGDVDFTAIHPGEAFSKAKAAAIRALEIDDSRSEAHASLAHLHMHYFEWEAAEREFIRAIDLNPGYPSAHQWYAYFLAFKGRIDEALGEISLAVEADPVSLIIYTDVGEILYYARRYPEAIERIRAALEMDPHYFAAHMSLGRAFEQQQMYDEAITEFETARAISDSNTDALASLAHAYAISGRTDYAMRLRTVLCEAYDRRYVSPYHLAIVCLGLGEYGEGLNWLEKAFEEQASWIIYLSVDPRLDPVRDDPRFCRLQRRLGLESSEAYFQPESDISNE